MSAQGNIGAKKIRKLAAYALYTIPLLPILALNHLVDLAQENQLPPPLPPEPGLQILIIATILLNATVLVAITERLAGTHQM